MKSLKRDPVKYIRDYCKAQYPKGTECYMCGATDELEFHHFYSVSELYRSWIGDRKVETVEDMYRIRQEFFDTFKREMLEECETLCKKHHEKLHRVFGRNPKLLTAKKQRRWVDKWAYSNSQKT